MKHIILALALLPNAAALADDELDALLVEVRKPFAPRVHVDTGIGGNEHVSVIARHDAKALAAIAIQEAGERQVMINVTESADECVDHLQASVGVDRLYVYGPRHRWADLVRDGVRAMVERTVAE